MRIAHAFGIVVALAPAFAFADVKSAAETAYCVGVYQHNLEISKLETAPSEKARHKELVLKKERLEAELSQAVKRKQIEYVLASKKTSAGYGDAKICSQTQRCRDEAAKHETSGAKAREECEKKLADCQSVYEGCK